MSDWKTHLKIGLLWEVFVLIICLIVVFNNLYDISLIEYLLILLLMVIAPLFPDIDHRSSLITVRLILFSTIGLWVTYFYFLNSHLLMLSILTVTVLISNFCKHRGLTHKWWFLLLINIALFLFSGMIVLSIISFVGMISHLYMDE